MSRRGWALFVAMSIIWGIPYLLIKVAVADVPPAVLVFGRTAIGALLLIPIAATRGHLRPLLAHWKILLAYTVVELAVPWLLLSDAEQHLSSSLTGLLVAAVPLVGAILALLVGAHEAMDARRLAGLVVGLLGVGVLLGFNLSTHGVWPVVEVGVVVVGYATGPLIIAKGLAGLPTMGVVASSLALCAIGYAPVAALQWQHTHLRLASASSVVGLGVVCTAVAFLLFFALIAEVGPSRATVITYVNPAVAVLLGVAVLGEPFTVAIAVGFGLILVGSVFATKRVRPRVRERVSVG